jgi:carboxypeptidase T
MIFLLVAGTSVFGGRALDFARAEDSERSGAEPAVVGVRVSGPEDLGRLIDPGMTVLGVTDTLVRVLATPRELHRLRDSGFDARILFEDLAEMWGWKGDPGLLQEFRTYPQMAEELERIAAEYPQIARLHNLGRSVEGRIIWGLVITDDPDPEENEAEVRICGLHHGDELMSAEIPLLLAEHLTVNYGADPYITRLVNEREIWIIPMVNPDGREARPYPERRNANDVDLNRDYGYMWDAWGGSHSPFSQPESSTMSGTTRRTIPRITN